MLKILKNFFNDDSTKVGLCGFNLQKPARQKLATESIFNSAQLPKTFKTDFEKNVLLI
ncbi:MAG TPA: hypothetical protein PKI94_06310 [Candidatus Gastranaerophilaceae bacterium]|nr:hypothetical protein [Candidatus Gastranaerophilaceae bacterium]